MLIYLLRHGRTERPGTYNGTSDVPLSAEGRRQILELRGQLAALHFDACFCSPLSRCRTTFELLEIGTTCSYDSELAEIGFGSWEGLSFSDICRSDQDNLQRWIKQKDGFTFPGGEHIGAFTRRVTGWFDRLAAPHADTVLIVSHGGVIRRAICHLLGICQSHADCFEIGEAGLAVIRREDDFACLNSLTCGS